MATLLPCVPLYSSQLENDHILPSFLRLLARSQRARPLMRYCARNSLSAHHPLFLLPLDYLHRARWTLPTSWISCFLSRGGIFPGRCREIDLAAVSLHLSLSLLAMRISFLLVPLHQFHRQPYIKRSQRHPMPSVLWFLLALSLPLSQWERLLVR